MPVLNGESEAQMARPNTTPDPFDTNPFGTDWEHLAHHIVYLTAGGDITDGPFRLTLSEPAAGRWLLVYDGDEARWEVQFTSAWFPGEDSVALEDNGTTCMILDGITDRAPRIMPILAAIAGGDPSRYVRPADTDNYYDTTGHA